METQGIYFLLDELGAVKYIGKTTNIKRRFNTHAHIPEGSVPQYKFIPVDNKSDMALLELAYIDKLKPKLNKQDKFNSVSSMNVPLIDVALLDTITHTKLRLRDDRFERRGYKMYNRGIVDLLDVLTNKEAKVVIGIFTADNVDKFNILTKPFRELTPELKKDMRSRLKSKLLKHNIMFEFNKKVMLNPFIFSSKGDKYIKNSKYLTQMVWGWLSEDVDKYDANLLRHAEMMFDYEFKESKTLYVGTKQNGKFITVPLNVGAQVEC